jgi:methionyl-tRNA formyltransferase
LNQTAWQIGRQIRAYSFRNYQLPKVNGSAYCNYDVLSTQTRIKPGTILNDCEAFTDFSTIDYDIRLYKDHLARVFDLAGEDDGNRIGRYEKNLVNIDDRNSKSWTLLMVAAYNGNLELAKFLISRGADVNAQNYKGTTVLMYAKDYALAKSDFTLFELLLSHGADMTIADYTGKKLRDYLTRSEAAALGIDK